jgi:hypothetical protein
MNEEKELEKLKNTIIEITSKGELEFVLRKPQELSDEDLLEILKGTERGMYLFVMITAKKFKSLSLETALQLYPNFITIAYLEYLKRKGIIDNLDWFMDLPIINFMDK